MQWNFIITQQTLFFQIRKLVFRQEYQLEIILGVTEGKGFSNFSNSFYNLIIWFL